MNYTSIQLELITKRGRQLLHAKVPVDSQDWYILFCCPPLIYWQCPFQISHKSKGAARPKPGGHEF